jgi:hypothetical protein
MEGVVLTVVVEQVLIIQEVLPELAATGRFS